MTNAHPPATEFANGTLRMAGHAILTNIPENITILPAPNDAGIFLTCTAENAASSLRFPLGRFGDMQRFLACARTDPFWMKPFPGTQAKEVPFDTQFLLLELPDGLYALLLPILDSPFRAALSGTDDDELHMLADTGDTTTIGQQVTALYLAVGDDPYRLMAVAARSVLAQMGSGRLRTEKPLPDFLDLFGWCTYNAFYNEVSLQNVRKGLEAFAAGGVSPTWLILDDGWLSTRVQPTGEYALTAFQANEKFPGGLSALSSMAKEEFGLRCFMVWHTMQGHWGGAEAASFPQYRIRRMPRTFNQRLYDSCYWMAEIDQSTCAFNLVEATDIARFHQDFHRFLRSQGVDGVKVDNQATLEAVATGQGGRVELMRRYHESLDASGQVHFLGRVINCMSCSTDMFYTTANSCVTRTSDDFFPNKPQSHGMHIYANAMAGFFAGEFIQPDWDMFWSLHPQGTLHAVARAVSGGPVYVSDEVGKHDFALLRKLVCSDGSVLRAHGVGRPTRDSLFANPLTADVPLKVFNLNLDAGVVGVFALRHDSDAPCRTTVCPSDVEGLAGEQFAVYAHFSERLLQCSRDEGLPMTLQPLCSELVTIVPLNDGIAPLGLLDMLNSAGAITAKGFTRDAYHLSLRDGGRFGACCTAPPRAVHVDGQPHAFTFEASCGLLTVEVADAGAHQVAIYW